MKRILTLIVAILYMTTSLAACSSSNIHSNSGTDSSSMNYATITDSTDGIHTDSTATADGDTTDRIRIVTTIFPEYDWVLNILGENTANADVTLLLGSGVDLHSYQPTADDILKISTSDLFIYVGGESDKWVRDALRESVNKNMVVLDLLDILGNAVKEDVLTEGMQAENHDHQNDGDAQSKAGHSDEEHENSNEGGETEYDEHVWLSLRNAEIIVESICDGLCAIDADHAEIYKANADAYNEKLNALDEEYKLTVDKAPVKTLLFGDRFPFRYLADDYDLTYYAAFAGCSAETEASFETITFLAGKVDELSLHTVMAIEGNDHKIAETIIQNTKTKDQQIRTLDSMQSVTLKDAAGGTTYLSIMEQNLSVLKESLS